ncbi:MAG: ice-binding family protein [Gammaproteobacteria bacterium]|nr:ice-binding family protein [Gammaproteobacteria bacterium]
MNIHFHKPRANLLAAAILLASTAGALAAEAPELGAAGDFSVLGGSNVTCTTSVVTSDVGVAPGSAVPYTNTGCTIAGAVPPATDADAVDAREDFLAAYEDSLFLQCTEVAGNLANEDLQPGAYCLDAVAKAGTLTLSGEADDVWVFLVDGALTGTNWTVTMNGGEPCNVYWIPTAATTLTTSALKGTIMAGDSMNGSVTVTGGSIAGGVLANQAVTLTNTSVIGCSSLTMPGDGDGNGNGNGNGNGAHVP